MKLHMQILIALGLGIKRNWHIFFGIILGILVGIFLHGKDYALVSTILVFIGQVFIRLIQMVVIPLVVSAIIIGITSIGDNKQLGKFGTKMIVYYGIITAAAVAIGRLFKMNGTNQDKLIASGAGAAIGATFNAPIAGTIFVLEELVNKFSASLLFPVLVATVTASSAARYFLGKNPSFTLPVIPDVMTLDGIFVCIVLGIISGFWGVAFAKVIFKNNDLFAKINIPNWAKPALAGFVVGIVGVFVPYVLGSGNLSVDMLLQHKLSLSVVVLVFFIKFFITPLCFGSGAAGGIFLPMLMLGSFLGYIVACISNYLGLDVNPVMIAMIGMAAFLSAAARTPITAVVMVFEMTGGYSHILPIMLSAAIADLIAEKLGHKPIYASLIVNQAKSPQAKQLSKMSVRNYMSQNVISFSLNNTIREVDIKINEFSHVAYPVKDEKNRLTGLITKSDVEDTVFQGIDENTEIYRIMNPSPITIKPFENLYIAYFRLHLNNTEHLVVVDDNNKIKGIITRIDINNALK